MSAVQMESGLWGVQNSAGKWDLVNISKSKAIAYVMQKDKVMSYRTKGVRIVKKGK